MTFDARWRAIQRETQLAASMIARGVTALGSANHSVPGLYSQALFSLSIGFERAGKLVYIADHAIQYRGAFPTNDDLRAIGHDIAVLLPKCETIGGRVDPTRAFADKPNTPIHNGIIRTLSAFAKSSRYYNLNLLAGDSRSQVDPIAQWWHEVGEPILAKHYTQRQRDRNESEANALQAALGTTVAVFHGDEAGTPINTLGEIVLRQGETKVVQKYGQLYVLQLARWFGSLIDSLSKSGAYDHRIHPLLGLDDAFDCFINQDAYLKSRRTWSIYTGFPGT